MMKTIKKMTLVVLMLVTTLSYAEKRSTAKYAKVAVVEFVNAKIGQQLYVKDDFGIILYSETVKSNGNLSKTFDLKQLKNGKYSVELNKDFEVLIKPFVIKDNSVVFLVNKETKVFKPMIRKENNKLLLSQMSLESKPVEIEIYYEENLIYSETVKDVQTINRVFKLQDSEFGNYYVKIKVGNRSYIEYFKI